MANILVRLEEYLKTVLGKNNLKIDEIKIPSLPFLLHDLYAFYKMRLLDNEFIIFTPKKSNNILPGVINKHYGLIKKSVHLEAFLLCEQVMSYTRRDLIKYQIPFVVPGAQMYLPMLGLDLRERFSKQKKKIEKLSPAAQVVILYGIYNKNQNRHTPSELSRKLKYSKMTIGRAFDGILGLDLAVEKKEGKDRFLEFENDKSILWSKTLEYMDSPVKKEVFISAMPSGINYYKAGLTALSEYTMIAPPDIENIAIYKNDFSKIREIVVDPINSDAFKFKMQLWTYPPEFFAKNQVVDELSLSLTFKDLEDERIEKSLEIMMENIKW